MTNSQEDRLDRSSRIVAQIPALLSEDGRYPLDGTLLYAEVDHGYVLPAIFVDRGDRIVYRAPDLHRLADALLALWKIDPPRKRWAEMAYVVRGKRFDVHFVYPEAVDPDEDMAARRERVVTQYLGAKPIVYPGGHEFTGHAYFALEPRPTPPPPAASEKRPPAARRNGAARRATP